MRPWTSVRMPHEIVRGGTDGDKVAVELEAILREETRDAGEALVEVFGCFAHIEVDGAIYAFAGDCTGDDVARSEFEQRMIAMHEAFAFCVD